MGFNSFNNQLRRAIEQKRETDAIQIIAVMSQANSSNFIADLNKAVVGKATPLMLAANNGCEKVVKALLATGVDITQRNNFGTAADMASNEKIRNLIKYEVGVDGSIVERGLPSIGQMSSTQVLPATSNLRGSTALNPKAQDLATAAALGSVAINMLKQAKKAIFPTEKKPIENKHAKNLRNSDSSHSF